jgi:hypothetical protein
MASEGENNMKLPPMSRLRQIALPILALLTIGVPASSQADDRPVGLLADYLATPGGLTHKSCVHELPDGALIHFEADDSITVKVNGSLVSTYPKCAFRGVPFHSPTKADAGGAGPSLAGYVEFSNSPDAPANGGRQWFNKLTGSLTVPALPSQNTTSDPTLYFFDALESNTTILQPVLQRGVSPAGGGNHWYMGSWAWHNGSGLHSALFQVAVGDQLDGSIVGNGCNTAGECAWSISFRDVQQNVTKTIAYGAAPGDFFFKALPAALEIDSGHPNLTDCNELPNGTGGSLKLYNTFIYRPPSGCTGASCSSKVEMGTNYYSSWSVRKPNGAATPTCSWNITNVSRASTLSW